MFSFHKPRVYRSTEGCCICRAKSSSSRFTDSRKYEEDSMKCFDLKYPRYGEICNACVLLVKRYKRLPVGSQRHWGHVVDARAGPGTKTITKIRRSKEESCTNNSSTRSNEVQNGKSVISEKFSKIFKKTKNKIKSSAGEERGDRTKTAQKSSNKLHGKMTLFKRPNSVESDNEHSRENSPAPTSSKNVQFQTQTRSSSHRSKNMVKASNSHASGLNKSATPNKPIPKISGSKRRKKLIPQKNRSNFKDSNVKFFDDTEWVKRSTCCGVLYECGKLPGAVIIDLDQFKLCKDHQRNETSTEGTTAKDNHVTEKVQKGIKATLPAIVKLSLPLTGSAANSNPTPVLKKHHLFYKRQSESFPHGDITVIDATTELKTETNSQAIHILTNNNSIENNLSDSLTTSKVEVSVSGPLLSNLPRYSNAKIATIVTPLDKPVLITEATNSAGAKSSSFLHRIKSDAGKIVKHSIEKLNSAVRLKAHDLSEIKGVVKTVDKAYIMSKTGQQNVTNATTLAIPELSPTSSSSTKFSDNSSDSGFDENVQDRKSVSPLQQENDAKLVTRPPVQTLILASGVRVHGQQQNLVYAGNETAAKILQNRMQQQNSPVCGNNNTTILQHNKRLNVQPLAIDPSTTLKLVQAKSNSNIVSIGSYNVGGIKMRPLYNNPIQHENGITTIVPASSLEAKQTDALMQATAPNTVTITPAPSNQVRLSTKSISPNYQFCQNNEGNSNSNINNNPNQINLNNASLNQKFILLKTSANTAFSHNFNCSNNKGASDMI